MRLHHLLFLMSGVLPLLAQTPPEHLEFDVASIHPHPPGETSSSLQLIPGGVNGKNVSLWQLVRVAYDIQEYQIQKAPSWFYDDHWDLQARTDAVAIPEDPRTVPPEQRQSIQDKMRAMMRALLADRFQLVIQKEIKEQSVYFLLPAKNGHTMKLSDRNDGSVNSNSNNGHVLSKFTGANMTLLAQQLSRRIGTTVIDKSGIDGYFDFALEWTPELGQPGAAASPAGPDSPGIFTALQEQLGLRLESGKGPTDVYVVQSVSRPSEN